MPLITLTPKQSPNGWTLVDNFSNVPMSEGLKLAHDLIEKVVNPDPEKEARVSTFLNPNIRTELRGVGASWFLRMFYSPISHEFGTQEELEAEMTERLRWLAYNVPAYHGQPPPAYKDGRLRINDGAIEVIKESFLAARPQKPADGNVEDPEFVRLMKLWSHFYTVSHLHVWRGFEMLQVNHNSDAARKKVVAMQADFLAIRRTVDEWVAANDLSEFESVTIGYGGGTCKVVATRHDDI